MKEAEKTSLKESERIEKEIAELKELKVRWIFEKFGTSCFTFILTSFVHIHKNLSTMKADDYFAKLLELMMKFDDVIRNDYWGY